MNIRVYKHEHTYIHCHYRKWFLLITFSNSNQNFKNTISICFKYYELGAYIHVVPNMILPCRLLYLFKYVNRLQIALIGIQVFNYDSAEEELKYSVLELNLGRGLSPLISRGWVYKV